MRVVVTGATSMIGVATIKKCIENDCEVLAIARKNSTRLDRLPKSDLINVEYADLDQLEIVEGDGKSYDVFYHFAWENTSKIERDNPIEQEINIKHTINAVKLAKKLGCNKFIGAGSQAEYGIVEGIISHDTPAKPVTAYGMAKYSAGLLSRRMCEQLGITFIWARIFSVYGIYDNPDTMINYAIDKFINKEIAHFSSATNMWNFLFEEDAGKMFYLLGVKNVKDGIYCIANTESRILRDYIKDIVECFNDNVQFDFAKENVKDTVSLNADVFKTLEAIDWKPQSSFKDNIIRIIKYKKVY